MMPDTENNDATSVNRRAMLQIAGGVATLGSLGVPAKAIENASPVGETTFIQVGISYQTDIRSELPHIEPMSIANVDPVNGDLYLLSDEEMLHRKFIDSDAIVDSGEFNTLPTTVYQEKKVTDVPVSLRGFTPSQFLPVTKPITIPTVRIDRESSGGVTLTVANKTETVPTGEVREIELEPKTANVPAAVASENTQTPVPTDIAPVIKARNHGELTVKAV